MKFRLHTINWDIIHCRGFSIEAIAFFVGHDNAEHGLCPRDAAEQKNTFVKKDIFMVNSILV